MAVPAAVWVVSMHPEITPSSNFYQLRDTTLLPVNGIKTEVINVLGPWKTVCRVEWETLKWVNWYNSDRLHSAIGYVTPKEAEEVFYANLNDLDKVA